MKKALLIIIFTFFTLKPMIAETIYGVVVDKNSGRGVVGLSLFECEKTITDKRGFFFFQTDSLKKIALLVGSNVFGLFGSVIGGHYDPLIPDGTSVESRSIQPDPNKPTGNDIDVIVPQKRNLFIILTMSSNTLQSDSDFDCTRVKYPAGELIDFNYYKYRPEELDISFGEYFDWKGFLSDQSILDRLDRVPGVLKHYLDIQKSAITYQPHIIDIHDLKQRWDDVISFPVMIIGEGTLPKGTMNEKYKANYRDFVEQGGCLFVEPQDDALAYEKYIPGFAERLRLQLQKSKMQTVLKAESSHAFAQGLGHQEQALIRGGIESQKDDVKVVLRQVKGNKAALVEYPFGKGKVVISMCSREEVKGPVDFGDPLQNQLLRWYAGSSRYYDNGQSSQAASNMIFHFTNDSDKEAQFITHQLFREGTFKPISEKELPLMVQIGQKARLEAPVFIEESGVYWHRLALLDAKKELIGYRFPERVEIIKKSGE